LIENILLCNIIDNSPLPDNCTSSDDALERTYFIDYLYNELSSIKFKDSFVYGLYGGWGEGKSWVITKLIEKFSTNRDFIIVKFCPWDYKDENGIIRAYYQKIERSISNKFIFYGIKNLFYKYSQAISMGVASHGIRFDLKSSNEYNISAIKKEIEKIITSIDKKILIIIDDIDRLKDNEIDLVFKLVRSNSDFDNTIFILCFDPDHIEMINRQDFLEKMALS